MISIVNFPTILHEHKLIQWYLLYLQFVMLRPALKDHQTVYTIVRFTTHYFLPDSKLGVAYINISLTERFSNLANMSFSIFMASRVYVHFLDNESSMIRLVHVSIDK